MKVDIINNLLTLIALILAFFAYRWSVIRYFDSWKSLFISFKNDLYSQKNWLSTPYSHYSYKEAYDPGKIIFPLSFESLPEIICKGVAEVSGISNEFINQLSLFNERILAFNSLLDNIKQTITADPILTKKTEYKLLDIGLSDRRITFEQFESKLEKLIENTNSEEEKNIYYLAKSIQSLNKTIHVGLISVAEKEDGLHSLYVKINGQVDVIINNFNKKIPLYIRKWWLLPSFLIIIYIIIIFI